MKMPRAASINGLAVLVVSIVILLISRSEGEAEVSISCPQVILDVAPCASFLQQENAKKPSKGCCKGVKKLNDESGTRKDRAAICECLKQALAKIGNYDPKRIAQLPKACEVPVKLPPIDQKTDCSKA